MTQLLTRINKFHDWGGNCKATNMSPERAEDILLTWYGDSLDKYVSVNELDAFWNGYHNCTRKNLVMVHGI